MPPITLIECPRDAMQGWPHFIPTQQKINYINALLKVGFDTIDFGSFVSPKAIPQLADTDKVLQGLHLNDTPTKLLAIVANTRGAQAAMAYQQISYIGFPFSISPTFQLRNTNSTIEQSLATVNAMQQLCVQHQKKLVVYISMGFGNPYGDEYNEGIVLKWVDTLVQMGISIISMADTVGLANSQQISSILNVLIPQYKQTSIGVHLHSTVQHWQQKIDAALQAGCTRFDGAIKGIGGCPMAGNTLVGNMDTELLIPYFLQQNKLQGIDTIALQNCSKMAAEIFI